MEFKKFDISDKDIVRNYLLEYGGSSCENAFVTLLVWQNLYNNSYAICEDQLIIKSGNSKKGVYRLPLGNDIEKGMFLIKKYSGEEYPDFWAYESSRFNEFNKLYGNNYVITEKRDAADYIYLQTDLSCLKGKKYHSKRNHISAFSKKYDWHYEEINEENIERIKICADKWYDEKLYITDPFLVAEKVGLETVLNNFNALDMFGGAIFIGNKAVAFSLASSINENCADIHFEKALSNFAESYTVINREFAKNTLSQFEYLNREDDMGLEGLRKAKLSYKPVELIRKYSLHKREEL